MGKWIHDEIQKLQNDQSGNEPLKIVNIGAGGWAFEQIKTIENADIVQVDIDEERNPDIVASVCDMKMFDDNSVDAIFMIEVLEHVDEPWNAIPELHRILKPGGKLILSTPLMFPLHDEPYDYYRYTKYGLQHLLKQFDQVNIRERNSYVNSIYVLFGRMIYTTNKKMKPLGFVTFLLMLLLLPIFFVISRLYKNHQSTTGYFTTAQKKIVI
ncbi:MAG: class I SAM-dependent methyltransferase [Bdellovibrionales bacterium]